MQSAEHELRLLDILEKINTNLENINSNLEHIGENVEMIRRGVKYER